MRKRRRIASRMPRARQPEILRGFTWYYQHANLCLLSDLFVCVGLLAVRWREIVWTNGDQLPRGVLRSRRIHSDTGEDFRGDRCCNGQVLEDLQTAIAREIEATMALGMSLFGPKR